jgi:hypothetical protein
LKDRLKENILWVKTFYAQAEKAEERARALVKELAEASEELAHSQARAMWLMNQIR